MRIIETVFSLFSRKPVSEIGAEELSVENERLKQENMELVEELSATVTTISSLVQSNNNLLILLEKERATVELLERSLSAKMAGAIKQ